MLGIRKKLLAGGGFPDGKNKKKNKGNNALMNVGLVQSGRPVSHKGNVGDLSSRMKETIVPRGTIALTNEKEWVSREKKKEEKQRERRYRQRDRKSPLKERSLSKEREMKVNSSGQDKARSSGYRPILDVD